ncbi:MAG TPA: molybdopterin-synthase adenylyltransferase MoeB [Gemmatimonadaceae bacterium]|jgi:adenylyltransferase/sulfurtransferase|nr:molybdopterin-synthase adenylyltransferase MoeB [Gemmatimonadaceae bacterium]
MPTLLTEPHLAPDELHRYHRQLILPEMGEEGQRRLRQSRVLLVGAGGLGSPTALYLAAAGVGQLGIIDADEVELSNLQRQVLHGTADVGRTKVASAESRLRELNPHVDVTAYHARLTSDNAMELLADYDVVVDGTDNFQSRYLINDACVLLDKPNIYGSVLRFEGQASVFGVAGGPCYRCLFREPPPPGVVPNCAEGGVLGVLPGLVGVIQATETIKLLTGIGEPLVGRLLLVDALRMRVRTIALERDPSCIACGTRELTALADYDALCGVGSTIEGDEADMTEREDQFEDDEVEPVVLAERLSADSAAPILIDVREPYEWQIARLPHAHLIPLNELPVRVASLDPHADYVVYCHHGMRSAAAVAWLRERGFARVRNLTGGIDRWSLDVDPTVRRY